MVVFLPISSRSLELPEPDRAGKYDRAARLQARTTRPGAAGRRHSALAQLVSYVLEAGEGASAEVRGMLVQALAPEIRSDVMVSTADLMRAEGRAEGRVEGRLEARREALTELLEARFGAIEPAHRGAIDAASLEQLIAWIRRVVVVPTAGEIFRK